MPNFVSVLVLVSVATIVAREAELDQVLASEREVSVERRTRPLRRREQLPDGPSEFPYYVCVMLRLVSSPISFKRKSPVAHVESH